MVATSKVLVVLHCFYRNELKKYLTSLQRVSDLAKLHVVATMPQERCDADQMAIEVMSTFPNAEILKLDNLGYDIGPFVEAIRMARLEDYDYVLKLHTKGRGNKIVARMNDLEVSDSVWTEMLVEALVGSEERFKQALSLFEDPSVGMVAAEKCIIKDTVTRRDYYIQRVNDELAESKLMPIDDLSFVAGTMFMMRASLLKPLIRYSLQDFGKSISGISDYTLAHTMERMFSAVVLSQGYEIRGIETSSHPVQLFTAQLHGNELHEKKQKKKKKRMPLPARLKRKIAFKFFPRNVIARSEYFDADWYQRNNPDIGDCDPAQHYLDHGLSDGRNPSRYFDNELYLKAHPGCARSGFNPLLHYECYGQYGRRGIGMPDIPGLVRLETIRNSPYFDADWYLDNCPDVKEKKADPLKHYLIYGGLTNRDPSPLFCSDEYLTLHPDVRRAKINPLLHYMTDGYIQGRELSSLEERDPTFVVEAVSCQKQYVKRPVKHRRNAIVATYSSDGRVSETLMYLLAGLQEVVDNILLVGDSPLIPEELGKLDGLVYYAEYERRGQYDFGSYKRGFALARELGLLDEEDIDELVVMNDSCYGPVYPFTESFDYMAHVRWNFWGYIPNKNGNDWHLCSFFYVFDRKVLDSRLLDEFFCRVQGKITRGVAIEQFEIQLSQVLLSQGMIGESYVPWDDTLRYNHRNIMTGLMRYRLPLIKKKSISGEAKENIFASLEIIKRDNPELYALMDTRQRLPHHNLPTLEDYREALPDTVARIRNKLRKGQKARVIFLVNDAAMFPGRPLFDLMLQDDQFDPYVAVIPDIRVKAAVGERLEHSLEEISKTIAHDRMITVEANRYGRWPDILSDADIVCFPSPYNVSTFTYNVRFALGRSFLPIIFNYGYYRSLYDRDVMGLYNYAYYWKAFFECEDTLEEYCQFSVLKGANASLSGYIKMDALASVKRHDHTRPCVLVALHHSVDNGFNVSLSLANFIRYYDYFCSLPDRYPGIDFIYRPHPQLFNALKWSKKWKQKQVDDFIAMMRDKRNVIWSDGGDYFQEFADSDACIQDCGSFLVEYLYTGKPCCYMLKEPDDIDNKFAPLGKACLEQCYISYSTDDIDSFIAQVVLGGDDPKAEGRSRLAERVMLNYPHAAQSALDDIKQSIIET